jgi:hypothetical protein
MSNKVNQALYDLVQSMTKSEKRYFKLISTRHTIGEENNYIRIFDYLDKSSAYNEDDLFKYFKNESFLNRFSITKKRLYNNILSALDAFHTTNSTEAQLYKMIHSADILYDKSLYDQSRRILHSAEKLAVKNELSALVLVIAEKQKRLIETAGYSALEDSEIIILTEKACCHLNIIQTQEELWAVKSRLFNTLSKKGVARSIEEKNAYNAIVNPIEDLVIIDDNTHIMFLYNHIMSAYQYAIGNLKESFDKLQNNLTLFNQKEKTHLISPNHQISTLTNAIYISDKLGQHQASKKILQQLKGYSSEVAVNEDLEIKLFSSLTSIELSMHLRAGSFEDALLVAEYAAEKMNLYGDKITPIRKAFLHFKFAVVYIGHGDFNSALKFVNEILNSPEIDKSEDIIGFTQLLDLLIHIELRHNKLLPYTLKNAQRFFKTRNRLYHFEKIFLQFIAKLIKCDDYFDLQTLWENLNNELSSISNDDIFESIALEYFDFQAWAEAKLKKKEFKLIVREKYDRITKTAC